MYQQEKNTCNRIFCILKYFKNGTLNAWNRMIYKYSCTLKALYHYASLMNWMHWKTEYQRLKCAKNAK